MVEMRSCSSLDTAYAELYGGYSHRRAGVQPGRLFYNKLAGTWQ